MSQPQSKQQQPGFIKSLALRWLGIPVTLANGDFWAAWYGADSWSGEHVSIDKGLQLSTFWRCVRLLSETIATLPLGFYRKQSDGSRAPATNHPLYTLLHSQPNADMTAVQFWEVVMASLLLWGNAYIEVVRNSLGEAVALDFLMPQRMTIRRLQSGILEYRYQDLDGKTRTISEDRLMHIPAFSLDGIIGLSPMAYARNVIGSAIAADKASAGTFKNALRSPGLVMMDTVLKKEQREDIREHVAKVNAEGGVMVLEKGAGFQQLSINPEDAQLLQTRSFNVEEICRWFGVPPFMVGHSAAGQTKWGTGMEQEMIGFLTFSLRPWLTRIEQSIRKNLLTPVERQEYFAEFAIEGLLRADSAGRAAYLSTMGQNGYLTRNEGRRLENLPPVAGGDVLTVQSNLVPIDQLGAAKSSEEIRQLLANWLMPGEDKSCTEKTQP